MSAAYARIKYLLYTYGLFLLFFLIQKSLFLLYYYHHTVQNPCVDTLRVFWHGLRMDVTVAGYLTLLPFLVLLPSIFYHGKIFARLLQFYFGVVALLTSAIFVVDLVLYDYWNFRLDATVFTYLANPKGAAASVSIWVLALGVGAVLACAYVQWHLLNRCVARPLRRCNKSTKRTVESLVLFLLLAPMGVAIRGGLSESTMNVGAVYFSQNMFLNHAAINPNFSLLGTLQYTRNFGQQYRFMPDYEVSAVFDELMCAHQADSTALVLTHPRPNIIFIILESFGAQFIESLGGAKGVTPNLEKIANEGILFTNMYANSFRTDRGIVSCLSGFPAQPTMSILKYPQKCAALPSIPQSLRAQGYHTQFLYGGDIDFAHVNTYFVSQKVTDIISQKNLPREELKSAWGAHDHIMFRRLMEQIQNQKEAPYLKMLLTLSSHEPFVVPYHKFDDPWLNAIAYTDHCLGQFIAELKESPHWDNTLLILVPDHAANYPNLTRHEPMRHHIFMVWAGGAVKEALQVARFCTQSDIAATLLNQIQIDSTPFVFSKDVFNPHAPDFALYTFSNGFGIVSPQAKVSFDCDADMVILEEGTDVGEWVVRGKAFLQKLYDVIDWM